MGYGSITKEEAQRREDLFWQGLKVCGTCKKELRFDEFTNDKTKKDGLSAICKDCQKEQRKRRKDKIDKWVEENQDRVKERQRQYSKEHTEEKKSYYQQHKEHLQEKRRQHYQENKETYNKKRRKYSHTLGERYKKYQKGAVDRGFDFTLNLEDFDEITQQPCFYCGILKEDEYGNRFSGVDRINPEEGYHRWNCIPCCFDCNKMKSNSSLEEWMRHMKRILDHMEHENHIVVSNITD